MAVVGSAKSMEDAKQAGKNGMPLATSTKKPKRHGGRKSSRK